MSTQQEPRSKRFKACRACRRQKMRCDGEIGKPCKRCKDFGLECLFDLMTPRAPRGHPKSAESASGPSSLSNSASSPKIFHEPQENDAQASIDPSLQSSTRSPDHERPNITETLEFDQATNPVTAIHAMTSKATTNPNDFHGLTSGRFEKSNRPNGELELVNTFVKAAFRDEGQARDLFHLYMANCPQFSPIVDPNFDTFDSLRQRSAFCLVAILSVATSVDSSITSHETRRKCKDEADKLAARSLFTNPCILESIQAIIILAYYSEKSWFAIGHALQMAEDIGLHTALQNYIDNFQRASLTAEERKYKFLLFREVRVWVVLQHMEREIALGTGREPRCDRIPVAQLRQISSDIDFPPAVLRSVATAEIMQLRQVLQNRIYAIDSLQSMTENLELLELSQIQDWWEYWNQRHIDLLYPPESPQRLCLNDQKDIVLIILHCNALRQVTFLQRATANVDTDDSILISVIHGLEPLIIHYLDFASNMTPFKWHLRWSPTYSALLICFIAALALKISTHPSAYDPPALRLAAKNASLLLEQHSRPKYASLVEGLLALGTPVHASTSRDNAPRTTALSDAVPTMSPNHPRQDRTEQADGTETSLENLNMDWMLDDGLFDPMTLLNEGDPFNLNFATAPS